MKRVVTLLLIALAATPLVAQDRRYTLTLWGSRVDFDSTRFDSDFDTETRSTSGFGLSANYTLTNHFAAEISTFSLRSKAKLRLAPTASFDLGHVNLVPVTLGVQTRFRGRGRVDPYAGAGAAYVFADALSSGDLNTLGVGPIAIEDTFSWYANAGVDFSITDRIGLALDARYIAIEPRSRSEVTNVEQNLDLTPLIVSAGLKFRF